MGSASTFWIVGFVDCPLPWWYRIFCRRYFRHCFALRYNERYGLWIFMEWTARGMFVEEYHGPYVDMILEEAAQRGTLVSYKAEPMDQISVPWQPLYCVSWLKHLLNIPGFAITPYQLFCELRKRGGEVITSKYSSGV